MRSCGYHRVAIFHDANPIFESYGDFSINELKRMKEKKEKKKKLDRKGKEWKYQRDNFPNIFLIVDEKEDTHTEEKTNKRSCDKFINDFN